VGVFTSGKRPITRLHPRRHCLVVSCPVLPNLSCLILPNLLCENFLYGFKAAPRAARAADTADAAGLPLTLPPGWPQRRSAGAKTFPVRGRGQNRQEVTGPRRI